MNRDEIEKLLGGYATNSLTEDERKALFEAALDDQELFNALEREQALKEVLDDPASRDRIRQALETPLASLEKPPWWRQWWTWGAMAGAVAASVTVFVLVNSGRQPNAPKQTETAELRESAGKPQTPAVASPLPERKVEAPRASRAAAKRPLAPSGAAKRGEPARDREEAKEEAKVTGATSTGGFGGAVPPPAPAPAQAQNAAAPSTPQSAPAPQAQSVGAVSGIAGFAPRQSRPPLRYSLLKLDENGSYAAVDSSAAVREGDTVRLNVQPSTPGYLNLYIRDASGAWRRFFPASGDGIKVNANATYTLPDAPIDVKEDEKLRLILSAGPVAAEDADALAANVGTKNNKSIKAKTVEIEPHRAERGVPVIVDITLGAKKE